MRWFPAVSAALDVGWIYLYTLSGSQFDGGRRRLDETRLGILCVTVCNVCFDSLLRGRGGNTSNDHSHFSMIEVCSKSGLRWSTEEICEARGCCFVGSLTLLIESVVIKSEIFIFQTKQFVNRNSVFWSTVTSWFILFVKFIKIGILLKITTYHQWQTSLF